MLFEMLCYVVLVFEFVDAILSVNIQINESCWKIDPCHAAAMLSPQRIKSFVFHV